MTEITLGLDDVLAARLAERAKRAGVTPEALASQLLAEDLGRETTEAGAPVTGVAEPFGFFDTGSSRVLRGRAVDELLTEGFGQ